MLAEEITAHAAPRLPRLAYRIALRAFPGRLRDRYEDEMLATFGGRYRERRREGRGTAVAYLRRALLDALVAGFRERRESAATGRHAPARGRTRDHRHALTRGDLRANERPRARAEARPRGDVMSDSGGGEPGGPGAPGGWTGLGVDLKAALRSLAAAPAFGLTVLVVTALGVGVNGALLTAVRTALLAPAPYPEPSRLVILDLLEVNAGSGETGEAEGPGRSFPWSYPKYEVLEGREGLAADPIGAYAIRTVTLTGRGEPVRLQAETVTPGYFEVLGLEPGQGRWLSREAGAPSREVVVSRALWRQRFGDAPYPPGGEAPVAGLNGEPLRVVGVAPEGFRGLTGRADLWVPIETVPAVLSPSLLDNADGHWLQAIGRLRDGATPERLADQMRAVAREVEARHPWLYDTSRLDGGFRWLDEARRHPRGRQAVLVVSAAALLVLLIACANLAGLMLARGADRRRDLAVRRALGGSRWRVASGLVLEVLVLSLAGGVLALLVAGQALRGLAAAWPEGFRDGGWNLQYVDVADLALDGVTMAVTLALALATGLLLSVGPALRLARTDPGSALRDGLGATPARVAGRQVLVAVEVALALVLVVGAGLMASSLGRLVDVDEGFEPAGMVRFTYSLPSETPYEAAARFHDEFLARVRALPGVAGATQGCVPLGGHCWISGVSRAGDRTWEDGTRPRAGVHLVDEHFFDTLGAPLVRGRSFEAREGVGTPAVVVINEAAARRLFPGEDPLGQPLASGLNLTDEGRTAEVIGVVGDVLYGSPAEGTMSEIYFLHRQEPARSADVIVRAAPPPGEPGSVDAAVALDLVPSIRAELAALDPDLPIYAVATVESLGRAQISDTRAVTGMLAAFAVLALLLAATGIWGVVAYSVTGRVREIGIRMALGAEAPAVVWLVLRQGMVAAVAGIAAGALAAWMTTRALSGLLYEVEATDPAAFLAGAAVLLASAALASWLPARRASRVDPMETLRAD